MKTNIRVGNVIVDKLVFTLQWANFYGDQYNTDHFVKMMQIGEHKGHCKRLKKFGTRYRYNINLYLKDGAQVLVYVGKVSKKQKADIRIEMNPAKISADGMAHFNKLIRKLFGPDYDQMIKYPRLSRVDFAIDIFNVRFNQILIGYHSAHRLAVFGKTLTTAGVVETMNFGSVSSDYQAAVYDKSTELRNAAVKRMLRDARIGNDIESLKENFLRQFDGGPDEPQHIRLEIRGRKLHGMSLRQFVNSPNRFEYFSFCDLSQSGGTLSGLTRKVFITIAQAHGVKAALAMFKGTKHQAEISAFWNRRQGPWWKPRTMWQQGCSALASCGVFPPAAFGANG